MKKTLTHKKIAVIVIILVCSVAIIRQQFAMHRVKQDVTTNQKKLEELQKQNALLEAELESAINQTDQYLEKLARERLGMIKQGEQVVDFNTDETE